MSVINLSKNQKIDLAKDDGKALTHFSVGLNWGAIEHTHKTGGFLGFGGESSTTYEAVDLDASAICFDAGNNVVDMIYYGKLRSSAPGAVNHSGDDREGDVGGDDGADNETIIVDLTMMPSTVDKVAFVLVSFRGHDFATVPHAGLRLYEGTPEDVGTIVATYNIQTDSEYRGHVAMAMGYIYRRGDGWKFQALGNATRDRDLAGVRRSVTSMLNQR